MSDIDARLSQLASERANNAEPELECLDDRTGETCQGETEHRMALSATGISYPRCDLHWDAALAYASRVREAYPDSSTPPDWYDPEAAGEYWDDDY